jgi:hypothetical protein
MSHVLKRADGFIRKLDREGNDMMKPIPISKITIYPKNKYSEGYKEVIKMATEKKIDKNV